MPRNRVTAILRGERAVTADTALRLARFFGTSPDFWLGLQIAHDLEATRAALGDWLELEVGHPARCLNGVFRAGSGANG